MGNVSALIGAIGITPEKIAVQKVIADGGAVTVAPAAVLAADNSPNIFALQTEIGLQESLLGLVDPGVDVGGQTTSIVNAIGQIVQGNAAVVQSLGANDAIGSNLNVVA
jgi:hypothetical protein